MPFFVECSGPACRTVVSGSSTHLYDDNSGLAFCGSHCFDDWAGDNGDVVAGFYKRLNLTEGSGA